MSPSVGIDGRAAAEWERRIIEHLSDGMPRTFTALAVVLAGEVPEALYSTAFERGLRQAISRGAVTQTDSIPIHFQIRGGHS